MTTATLNRSLMILLGLALLAALLGAAPALAAPLAPSAAETPVASALGGQVYVVRRGDTLAAIAQRFGVTVAAIMAANDLHSTMIYPGQSLRIPAPATGCTNKARFIADVTIPDNTVMAPGQSFVKTWRVRNEGTCAWEGYQLAYYGGATLTPTRWVALPATQSGQTVDVSIRMTAPTTPGEYGSNWILRDNRGAAFGFGRSGRSPVWVQIIVANQPPAGGTGTISGTVWEDYCRVLENGGPSGGCVPGEQGGYRADGIYNNGEHGIEGIEIVIYQGACRTNSTAVAARAVTDWAGRYSVTYLQPDTYCVSINTQAEPNLSMLLPGDWTFPGPSVGTVTVPLGPGEHYVQDFGWDYQFK